MAPGGVGRGCISAFRRQAAAGAGQGFGRGLEGLQGRHPRHYRPRAVRAERAERTTAECSSRTAGFGADRTQIRLATSVIRGAWGRAGFQFRRCDCRGPGRVNWDCSTHEGPVQMHRPLVRIAPLVALYTLSSATAARASAMPAIWRRVGHSRNTSAASRMVPAG